MMKRIIARLLGSKWIFFCLAPAFLLLSTYIFANQGDMGIGWTFPYFSGAANFERLFDWQISPSDYDQARQLSSEEYRAYKHQRTDDLIINTVNNYGYVLIALTSRTIFPFLGDLHGVILFQLLVHLAASLFILLMVLRTQFQRYCFLLFYVANPLIVYFTTYPFYYFWMFLSSLAFAVLILKPEWRNWLVFVAVPVLLFSLLIRPTTLFLAGFFFVIAFYKARSKDEKRRTAVASAIFLAGVIFIASLSTSSPWSVIYTGIGAYPNNFGVSELSEYQAYEYFYSKTGIKVDTDTIYGNWGDPDFKRIYAQTLKERYFEIVRENPWPLIRNAILNILQIFSLGHIVNKPMLTLASTALGSLVLAFLIYTKQYIWILAILLSAISFVLYYPPIRSYNFAAYLLLAMGIIAGLEYLLKRSKR